MPDNRAVSLGPHNFDWKRSTLPRFADPVLTASKHEPNEPGTDHAFDSQYTTERTMVATVTDAAEPSVRACFRPA